MLMLEPFPGKFRLVIWMGMDPRLWACFKLNWSLEFLVKLGPRTIWVQVVDDCPDPFHHYWSSPFMFINNRLGWLYSWRSQATIYEGHMMYGLDDNIFPIWAEDNWPLPIQIGRNDHSHMSWRQLTIPYFFNRRKWALIIMGPLRSCFLYGIGV